MAVVKIGQVNIASAIIASGRGAEAAGVDRGQLGVSDRFGGATSRERREGRPESRKKRTMMEPFGSVQWDGGLISNVGSIQLLQASPYPKAYPD
jgi:hypothetical protein